MHFRTALLAGTVTLAITATLQSAETTPTSRLCYMRDTAIYVADIDGKNARQVLKDEAISYPAISPDASRIVYTLNRGDVDRDTVILHLDSGRKTVLDAIKPPNSYAPVWSPDGKWILVNHYDGSQWEAAIVGADNTGFRRLTQQLKDKRDFTSVGWWDANSLAINAYDFQSVYHVDLTGKELDRRPVTRILGDAELSSGYTFSLSSDGKRLLYGALKEVDDIEPPEGGPPIVTFLLDIDSDKPRRVSPKGWHCGNPAWLPSGDAFIAAMFVKEPAGIYRIPLDGGTPVLLVKDGTDPSVSR